MLPLKQTCLFTGGKITLYQPINLYRKFKADQLFTGNEILPGNFVLITNPEGIVIEIADEADAGGDIEIFSGMLTPGFINAHCHLELSYLKNVIPSGTGLVQFVQQVMSKRGLLDEVKIDAINKAELEMYDNGIVAVGDICNTADTISIKQKSKLQWHNFIEVSGFTDASADKRMEAVKKVFEDFHAINQFRTTLSPHAPYSVSKAIFTKLNIETANQIITIHNQECTAENDLYQHKTGGFLDLYKNFSIDISAFEPTGKTSLQSWLPYFNNHQLIISVHNTFTSNTDIDFCNERSSADGIKTNSSGPQLIFCLCVNANKYIEQKLPPIDLLRENNYPIVIGTDSYASNRQLNILEEIKTIQRETSFSISLSEILQWATINGARGLQMDDTLGSFAKGKKPGIVLIEGIENLNTTAHSSSRRIL